MTISWEVKSLSAIASLVVNGKAITLSDNGVTHLSYPISHISLKLVGAAQVPKQFALEQNYPNPFNPTTVIRYQLPVESRVTLKIYNVLGQTVTTLTDKVEDAGYKSVEWDARNVASGIYFYRMEAKSVSNPSESFTRVKKLLLLR